MADGGPKVGRDREGSREGRVNFLICTLSENHFCATAQSQFSELNVLNKKGVLLGEVNKPTISGLPPDALSLSYPS